jgi:hypothetical protein
VFFDSHPARPWFRSPFYPKITASPGFRHAATAVADEKLGESLVVFRPNPLLIRDRQLAAQKMGPPEIAMRCALRVVDVLPMLITGNGYYQKLKKVAEGAA